MLTKQNLIGIDFGSSAIKIVDISGKTKPSITAIGTELLPNGAITNGTIKDLEIVTSALQSLIRESKVGSRRHSAVSVGGSSVIIKRVNFPNVSDDEIHELVEVEAEQHFQHDIRDLHFTSHLLPPLLASSTERSVLLVGVKKNVVSNLITVLKSCNLKLGVIDCEVFALSNMLTYNSPNLKNLVAIIHIGASSTQVIFLANEQFLYNRAIPIGGDYYSQKIAEHLNITPENAEVIKISSSDHPQKLQPELEKVVDAVNHRLASEIQVTVDFFLNSDEIARQLGGVAKCFLGGGGSMIPRLRQTLGLVTGLKVEPIKPFENLSLSKKISESNILKQSPLYGIGVGLALRQLDDYLA